MSAAQRGRRIVVWTVLAGLVPVLGCTREPAEGAAPAAGAELALEPASAPAADAPGPSDFEARPPDPQARGLVLRTADADGGYLLFSPLVSDTTYLIDREGRPVHTWKSQYAPGSALYLLPNGHLLRNGRDPDLKNFRAGGTGGIFQQLDWDGQVVWEWTLSSEERVQHHDIEPLPNGNILALGWEVKTPEECARAGRRPDLIPENGLWPDFIVEIQPIPPDDARIVWEWHAWDHVIQERDPTLDNFADPALNPGRFDINGLGKAPEMDAEELEQLKALGYVPEDAEPQKLHSDFLHVNAIAYNAPLDQIAVSVPEAGEIWIIDHSTTTEEARTSAGGRSGRGGDLLYRWGNPRLYGRGDASAQQLFYQHAVHWIPEGLKGAGHLLLFNNGRGRSGGGWSSIVELVPPLGADGRYPAPGEASWGPPEPVWTYAQPETFYAPFISGARRLENGHTMICSGPNGRFFEIDANGEVVWEYWNPYEGDIRMKDGSLPQPGIDRYPYAVFQVAAVPANHPALADRRLAALEPPRPLEPVEFGP
jgi:hypothetical protein